MTVEEKIHVFENSRLVSDNFTTEAVTAAYVEALAALRSCKEQTNEPLTLDELMGMRWEPVYIEIKETFNKASPLVHAQWAVISAIENGSVTFTDDEYCDLDDYGQIWLAYRRNPEQEKIENG